MKVEQLYIAEIQMRFSRNLPDSDLRHLASNLFPSEWEGLEPNVCFGRLCVVTGTSPDKTTVLGLAVLQIKGSFSTSLLLSAMQAGGREALVYRHLAQN